MAPTRKTFRQGRSYARGLPTHRKRRHLRKKKLLKNKGEENIEIVEVSVPGKQSTGPVEHGRATGVRVYRINEYR